MHAAAKPINSRKACNNLCMAKPPWAIENHYIIILCQIPANGPNSCARSGIKSRLGRNPPCLFLRHTKTLDQLIPKVHFIPCNNTTALYPILYKKLCQ